MKKALILSALVAVFALAGWVEKGMACNPTTFYGCSAEYKIAAQKRQFNSRNYSVALSQAQVRSDKSTRQYYEQLAKARAAEASKQARAKARAISRHESANKAGSGRTSFLTQDSNGTWVQTEIQRPKGRGNW